MTETPDPEMVVVIPSGSSYHKEGCGYLQNSSNHVRMSRAEAEAQEYRPCECLSREAPEDIPPAPEDNIFCINCGRLTRSRSKAWEWATLLFLSVELHLIEKMFPSPGEEFPFCTPQCFFKWAFATLSTDTTGKMYCVLCKVPQPKGARFCIKCGEKGPVP